MNANAISALKAEIEKRQATLAQSLNVAGQASNDLRDAIGDGFQLIDAMQAENADQTNKTIEPLAPIKSLKTVEAPKQGNRGK